MAYSPRNINGQSTMANSSPVVVASDQSKIKVDLTDTTANSVAIKVDGSSVTQPISVSTLPLPTGAATAAKQPALGTAGTPSADVITVQGVTSMTALKTDGSGVTQPVSGTITATGSSTGAAVPSTAIPAGFQARTSDPTATTTTYNTIGLADIVGKQVVMPYAIKENFIKGNSSATGTTSTAVTGIGAAGAGIKNYITGISIANTGTSTSLITLQDGNAGTTIWQTIAPAGGGSNITFPTPIATSANTALYFAAGTASTTIYVSATGYTGV